MASSKTAQAKKGSTLQLNMFAPESSWTPPALSMLPASWAGARRIAVDTETRDPDLRELGPGVRRDAEIVGYSFAIDDGPAFYVPVAHLGGDNVEDPAQAWRYLEDQAKVFTGEIVGTYLNYDLDFLAQARHNKPAIVFRGARAFRDIMVADALIYELHNSYGLDAIAKRLGFAGKNEELLRQAAADFNVDPKGGLWRLPARYVGAYAEDDAHLPLRILALQEQEIAAQELNQIWEVESALLPVLVKMRRRGVRIDFERLARIEDWSLEEEAKALAIVKHETGVAIDVGDVWRAAALAPALERVGINVGRTAKTGAAQIDKALLNSEDHPVLNAILWARKVNKLRTTFAQSVRTHAVNGRIHTTFNQLFGEREDGQLRGARFGRMSCENPNLQQQPSRDEFAAEWRAIYIPEEGMQWGCMDFSQQEPRWCAHFANAMRLEGAAEMVRRYNEDPNTDNHQMMADITGLPRKEAKIVYLGIMYGEGGYKLCVDLGYPTAVKVTYKGKWYAEDSPEGQEALGKGGRRVQAAGPQGQAVLDRFDDNAPFVRKLSKACSSVAEQRGYIRTILGRRCRFPKDEGGNFDWTYKALNRLIQGSSGDQCKAAMVEVDRAGHHLALQVHDELDCSIKDRKEGEAIAEIMQNVIKMSVPFKVDVEVGPSWGEAK
jgi:DNA polymerase I-like protein with 3'-5' exonuclease and polymerase domains